MAFHKILDSDVDRLTAMAIRGVNAFITLYDDERDEPASTTLELGAGPAPRKARRNVMPAAGMPAAGMPAAGMPAAGMPAAGKPAAKSRRAKR